MVLESTRPAVVRRLRTHVGRLFAPVPIRPNTWTLLSLPPAIAGLYALAQGAILAGVTLFAAAGFVDVVDGAVARERNEATPFGAYLDGMVDRFVEAALLIGLMLFGYPEWLLSGWLWLALLLFFGTAMTSFSRAYADHRGAVVDPDDLAAVGGLLERAERLLLIYASMVLWTVEPVFGTYAIALATFLAVVTVIQRMRYAQSVVG